MLIKQSIDLSNNFTDQKNQNDMSAPLLVDNTNTGRNSANSKSIYSSHALYYMLPFSRLDAKVPKPLIKRKKNERKAKRT
jgi:hypothetical protein